jgi:hypothetical protein
MSFRTIEFTCLFLCYLISVPPEKPVVRDRHGQELLMYDIGPYEIEQDLILECEVSGGELKILVWSFMAGNY